MAKDKAAKGDKKAKKGGGDDAPKKVKGSGPGLLDRLTVLVFVLFVASLAYARL